MNILITGATGNIGSSLLEHLRSLEGPHKIFAGVRDVEKAKKAIPGAEGLTLREFDFENPGTFGPALAGIDAVFLLRPPHISKVQKYFVPLFDAMRREGISKAMLLSVQGAERSEVIPHRQIEKLILAYGFDHIFIRPSYFMQNLTTTLRDDVQKRRAIVLPAGNAKFNWVDADNVAGACARCLVNFDAHRNRAYEVTGGENLDFPRVVDRINELTRAGIAYRPVGLLRFFFTRLRERMPVGMIFVMMMLHFLPRVQAEPALSMSYRDLTGKDPKGIDEFIMENRDFFRAPPRAK